MTPRCERLLNPSRGASASPLRAAVWTPINKSYAACIGVRFWALRRRGGTRNNGEDCQNTRFPLRLQHAHRLLFGASVHQMFGSTPACVATTSPYAISAIWVNLRTKTATYVRPQILPDNSIHQSSLVTFSRLAWTMSLPVAADDRRHLLNTLTRLTVLKTPLAPDALVSFQCWLGCEV